jgi:hypothetical protein
MKNIHVLSVDKPTLDGVKIYITDDEKIKEGDWVITPTNDIVQWAKVFQPIGKKIILTDNKDLIKDGVQAIDDEFLEWFVNNPSCEFVNVVPYNGYDEERGSYSGYEIIIPKEIDMLELGQIIPKEEPKQIWEQIIEDCGGKEAFMKSAGLLPKQETLEEAIQKVSNSDEFNNGALFAYQWQQQQDKNKYSEEEVQILLETLSKVIVYQGNDYRLPHYFEFEIKEVIKQFKNK